MLQVIPCFCISLAVCVERAIERYIVEKSNL